MGIVSAILGSDSGKKEWEARVAQAKVQRDVGVIQARIDSINAVRNAQNEALSVGRNIVDMTSISGAQNTRGGGSVGDLAKASFMGYNDRTNETFAMNRINLSLAQTSGNKLVQSAIDSKPDSNKALAILGAAGDMALSYYGFGG